MNDDLRRELTNLLEWCKHERDHALRALPLIEAGHIKTGHQELGARVVDTTADYKAQLEGIAERMSALIATLERDLA